MVGRARLFAHHSVPTNALRVAFDQQLGALTVTNISPLGVFLERAGGDATRAEKLAREPEPGSEATLFPGDALRFTVGERKTETSPAWRRVLRWRVAHAGGSADAARVAQAAPLPPLLPVADALARAPAVNPMSAAAGAPASASDVSPAPGSSPQKGPSGDELAPPANVPRLSPPPHSPPPAAESFPPSPPPPTSSAPAHVDLPLPAPPPEITCFACLSPFPASSAWLTCALGHSLCLAPADSCAEGHVVAFCGDSNKMRSCCVQWPRPRPAPRRRTRWRLSRPPPRWRQKVRAAPQPGGTKACRVRFLFR